MSWGPGKPPTRFDVKALRKHMGLSQNAFALVIQTASRTVRRWERSGHTPQRLSLQRLRELHEVHVNRVASGAGFRSSRTGQFAPSPSPAATEATLHIGVLPSRFFG